MSSPGLSAIFWLSALFGPRFVLGSWPFWACSLPLGFVRPRPSGQLLGLTCGPCFSVLAPLGALVLTRSDRNLPECLPTKTHSHGAARATCLFPCASPLRLLLGLWAVSGFRRGCVVAIPHTPSGATPVPLGSPRVSNVPGWAIPLEWPVPAHCSSGNLLGRAIPWMVALERTACWKLCFSAPSAAEVAIPPARMRLEP